MAIIRAWLILRIKGTKKVVILKRSKKSRNKGQWDFIGGSDKRKRIRPRNLIRKESHEEIGMRLLSISTALVVRAKFSTYHYFISDIKRKDLDKIVLNYEHSKFEVLEISKLRKKKRLHHSIKIYLKYLNHA